MKKAIINIGGAGIAGLTSAIILSRAGYKVRVFERYEDVGKRFREDLEGLMNWGFDQNALDFMRGIGLKIDFWNKPLNNLSLLNSRGKRSEIKCHEPFVYLVKRGGVEGSLDYSLKMQAIENGAEVMFNRAVSPKDVDIIATGPRYDGITDAMALGYSFRTNLPDMYVATLSRKLSCGGYSYLLVADGYGTIASCNFGNYRNMSRYLDETVIFFRKHVNFDMKNEKKFAGFGNFFNIRNRRIYIGEAGEFQDFLWGFGMRYAMLSADLASRSIIEGKNFTKLWKAELCGHKRSSVANRLWFSMLNDFYCDRLIDFLCGCKDPLKLIDNIYRGNWLTGIIYPFARIYFHKNIQDRLGVE